MYCPKCGTENPDANKFCRACRESLLLVAQALKKRLPLMIASKLDVALERLSERFRRDSILLLVLGIGFPIVAAVDSSKRADLNWQGYLPFLVIDSLFLLMSRWSYLAYKRSLTLGERLESGKFVSGSPVRSTALALGIQTLDLSETEATVAQAPELQVLFCPACGAKAAEALKHCRSCGTNLHAVRSAVEPSRWRLALNSWLDRYIERRSNKSKIRKDARGMLWMSLLYFVLGVNDVYKGHDPTWLLFGFFWLVTALWDRAASRRWFAEAEAASDTQAASSDEQTAVANAPTTNELILPPAQVPLSVIEATTRKLEPVVNVVKDDALNIRQL